METETNKIKWIKCRIGDFPKVSGVYCIYRCGRIAYIGSSINLFRRVNRYHDKFNLIPKIGISAYYFQCDNYIQLEKRLIIERHPSYNFTGKWPPFYLNKKYFVFKIENEDLRKRYCKLAYMLYDVSRDVAMNGNINLAFRKIADDFEISPASVSRYIFGNIQNGYLAHGILTQLKKIRAEFKTLS